ncbi:unnamed protein product [Adineta steineri]|uniref:Chorein N-terminal domain-containing protein n=1 Tax=Adineta steineri TaxID=433720 RepID=A0A818VDR4_9BILA|nr:unnamed protein product [Adineta steineri]CAF3707441.1 unnamed protein product [Adineta steineri]
MVWKNFIHYLINKYLKNYIERLDYEKLDLSLKNGHVLLDNLRLKPEALAYFNIPATVAVGYIERLQVTIPWMHLNTKSTEVHIDGLYLLIVPKKELSQDLNEIYSDKMARVQQKLENLRKSSSDNANPQNKETPFVEKMRLQVMQNLIITIQNVHISYEMKSSAKLGHPFSFGLTLHYLELRIKEMKSLSFYWNTKCKSRLDMPFKDVVEELKSKIAKDSYIPKDADMNYILRPVTLDMECTVTLRPKESYYERSRVYCDIQVEQVSIHVNPEQISDVLAFIKVQKYTTFYDRCREYRLLLLQESIGNEPLTQEQKERINFLEKKLDVFNMAYIRFKMEEEANLLYPPMEDKNGNQGQLETSQMPGSPSTSVNSRQRRWKPLSKVKSGFNHFNKIIDHVKTTIVTTTAAPFLQNEQEYVYEDLPKVDVEVTLSKADLNIISSNTNIKSKTTEQKDETIIYICVTDIWTTIKRMSVSRSIECMIDLQTVNIYGMKSNNGERPILITGVTSSFSPFVHVEFELFPADKKSDYRLYLVIEPLKVFYDVPTVNFIVQCFGTNRSYNLQPQTQIKQSSNAVMEHNALLKKVFDINMNFKGVSLLLPQYNVSQQNISTIRIQFDDMNLKSYLDKNNDNDMHSLFPDNLEERQFYAKYKFELSNLRIVYMDSNKNRLYILRRTPLIDINFYKCIYSHHEYLAKWRIGTKIAMGDIQLSKTTLTKLMPHLEFLPLLFSNLAIIIRRINRYFVIFSRHTSSISDMTIYNCCLQFLMHPKTSFRTDAHISVLRSKDTSITEKNAIITLNNPTIIRRILSTTKQ